MWRYTGNAVKVFVLDARACFPILAFALYWSWKTLEIAVIGTVFFGIISWFGLTLPALLRLLRRWLNGPVRTAVPTWARRRLA
jgi:intracellular multiplication protein IcmT